MTNPFIALQGVSMVLPSGKTVFSELTETFDHHRTGLVGRNGAGKTLLAEILCGQRLPTRGRCLSSGTVHYLAQQVALPTHVTVAELAGVKPVIDALMRIEAGSNDEKDFECVGDAWDIRVQLQHALADTNLARLTAETLVSSLSGGEAMRVALAGAWLSSADFLILDEPTNHLDRDARKALMAQINRWHKGLLVISHDRSLLSGMTRIVELSPAGLKSYGGNYAFYAEQKNAEQHAAIRLLEQRKLERKREEQHLRVQREKQDRQQVRGNQQGKDANQAKILLDRQKNRSETSRGKRLQQQAETRAYLDQQVKAAADALEKNRMIALHDIDAGNVIHKPVVKIEDVILPFTDPDRPPLNLTLQGGQRIGVTGPNGCGKSTLLRVLAGQLEPCSGSLDMRASFAWLDQHLLMLDPDRSVLALLLDRNTTEQESELRMKLAQLALDADSITVPSAALSGGERLKAALACELYAETPPEILLLDEPGNHLDIPSLEALESLLAGYNGTLVVVSHDPVFLQALNLTHELQWRGDSWHLEARRQTPDDAS